MISFRDFALRRGERVLLSQVDLTLHAGWRVGVIGRNGCGKTSLFAAVQGEVEPDRGDLELPRSVRIATVAQETPSLPDKAIDFVMGGDLALAEAWAELERAEHSHDPMASADAYHRIEQLGGFAAEARAGKLLHGLGFKAHTHQDPVSSFSGGWRVRLNLARALMAPSDVLLLDEPTNHLDLDAVVWLEEWLKKYEGTLLIISHDREFLDGVASHILHLADGKAKLYIGNYAQFERQRAEQLRQQQIAFEKEQAERAHLQKFIDRFKAKASKAKQAQSRVKRLEKMKGIEAVRADRPFHFEFSKPEKLPNTLLRIDEAFAGYGDKIILNGVKVGLDAGDRIGLLGPNGEGKSTLVKTIAGDLPLIGGVRTVHPDLRVGYFTQHTVESLDLKASAIEHFKLISPNAGEQVIRNYLGGWNFAGDRAFEVIEPFSGGEKARLALALIAWRKPNLLLLDEPTNHLDLEMREALADALNDFDGAMVLVSHDRSLMGLVCDTFLRVADGEVMPFDGDFDDYASWLRTRRNTIRNNKSTAKAAVRAEASESVPAPAITAPSTQTSPSVAPVSGIDAAARLHPNKDTNEKADDAKSATERRKLNAEQREREKPMRQKLKKLESEISKWQAELAQITAQLSDAGSYDGSVNISGLAKRQGEINSTLQETEAHWLELYEELEKLAIE